MRLKTITTIRGCMLGVVALAQLCAPSIASAQGHWAYSSWDSLSLTEPGGSDLGPLGVTSRLIPSDLRQDWNFETLYQGRGENGRAWFARRNAGLTAVFPRSVYVPTRAGQVPLIPPDTTFVIGEPNRYTAARLGLSMAPPTTRDASGGLRIDNRISLRSDNYLSPVLVADRHTHSRAVRSPRRGVARLLQMAAERERLGY